MSDNRYLLTAVRMNASFSTLSAVVLFAANDWITAQLGLPNAGYVTAVALILGAFALQLWNIVYSRKIRRWEILTIIAMDLGWVVTSVLLLAIYNRLMTIAGLILVASVAVVVLFFAIAQNRGLQRCPSA